MANFLNDELLRAAIVRPVIKQNPANWMHERIVKSINDFEKTLDGEHEVAGRLVSFGSELIIHIEDVGSWGPDMIMFYGSSNGKQVELLQHISQLSVLLIAIDKTEEEPRRIGFRMLERLKQTNQDTEDEDDE